VSEADCNPQHSWIRIPGYRTEFSNTHIYGGKCRLIAFISQTSPFLRSRSITVPSDVELMVFETAKIRVVGIYRPFKQINDNTANIYFNKLMQTLNETAKTRKDTCIGGDFNINFKKNSPEKDVIETWSLDFNLVQLVNEHTWERIIKNPVTSVPEIKRSTLDLVFVNCEGEHTLLDKYTSDHKCIMFQFKSKTEQIVRQKVKRRSYIGYNPQKISNKINEDLRNQSFTGDADFDADLLTNVITDVLDLYHPLRTIRTARATDVTDQDLEKIKKRRKRLLKKFHKEPTQVLHAKIIQLNKLVKKQIKSVKIQQLGLKLEGKNPKSFWNAVAELEGKRTEDNLILSINDSIVSESAQLAEEFGNFFQSKVEQLSGNHQGNNYKIGHTPLNITINEIKEAASKLKPKLCQGEDGITMKVVRDLSLVNPGLFVDLFNSCCRTGIPSAWKTAIVKPLHKKGPKDLIANYRPISNLSSISKLFEKIILARIDALGELDGSFQHGFKKNRSTTSAMLELQDFVATELDKNKIVGTYSIDLSAAFDLLRPDIFLQTLREKIPLNIMQVLMDFMSERSFKVDVHGIRSKPKGLSVGCVQGSILGPRLFTLYLSQLTNNLPVDAHVVSYADDTYVSISKDSLNDLKPSLIQTMLQHDAYLKTIGMVTNVSKTELTYFSRTDQNDTAPLVVGNDLVKPQKSLKVLGLVFDHDLSWTTHSGKLKQKAALALRKLKFLSRYVDQNGMKKIITTHLFGMLYYSSVVWLNELSTYKTIRTLESIHFRGLRIAAKDFFMLLSKERLYDIFGRATPTKWMKYSNARAAINMLQQGNEGPPISASIRSKLYINDRNQNKISVHDTSRLKIGRHSFHNRLKCLREVNFDWRNASKDSLRVNLKKTFFTRRND